MEHKTYEVVLRSFLSDDVTLIIPNVANIEFSNESFVVLTDKENCIVGAFDRSYIKGFYKTK
ncbi:hypothetical protein [Pseudoneobacillus rhizosphaerae]|uniref:Uncharacterized protein n=1 Tax=Pseudoneobacillus rhizosphaerae TaxID=2880968 RepID=A0A9C7G8Q5_9BACI|nr:hypothetical protein [Pseudoneobacillus rhizosphaerae]CAG9608019.1 hypothetical protein NEOCIP111885_01711 [Pseudoneobacillus rhizosphaerae]